MTTSTASISRAVRSGEHGHVHTRLAVAWGLVAGLLNAAFPFLIWWIDAATVHALIISLIAAVYVGFAVADGRPRVIAVECTITVIFVLVAMTAVSATPWLIVAAYAAHGLKDLWQMRHQFVDRHPLVAAVLRHHRLARRRDSHRRDRRRPQVPLSRRSHRDPLSSGATSEPAVHFPRPTSLNGRDSGTGSSGSAPDGPQVERDCAS